MIAADTSALSSFLKGEKSAETEKVRAALLGGQLSLPPIVVTELLSDPQAVKSLQEPLRKIALLEIVEGYWHRAGEMRRELIHKGLKAKTADALIAQSCLDHDVALITRDSDFRHFAKHCGLKLA